MQLNDEPIAERLRDYLSSARHLTVATTTTTTTFTTTSYCTYSTTSITTCLSIPVFGRRNLVDRRRQLLSNGDEEYASENSRLKDLPTILNEKYVHDRDYSYELNVITINVFLGIRHLVYN